ncbi:MAG TPA: NAD(P)-dependent oxidoreductase [Patescibacteria group bacterium]|nr:NAD(P)-dependent oxidoreductase [Patescibacteria group bacterium]
MKILGFGLNGMVGTRVVEVLKNSYEFENVSRSTGVDITNREQVLNKISSSDANFIFNLAAKTNVDGCEKDKSLGEEGEAWKINVDGVKNLVSACEKSGKKLLHISTDFVFGGGNDPADGYVESDTMNPVNWYGTTKAKADEIISQSKIPFLILRPAFPYTFLQSEKHFVAAMYSRLVNKQPIAGITDERFTPTWIDDIAAAIDILLRKNETGIYHVGGNSITPYDAALTIAKVFGFDQSLISSITRKEYFAGKAERPSNTALNSGKITKLGLSLMSFEEGIQKVQSSKFKV